ncbi:TlpA disulfide reductase family protein [Spirosoma sp. KUDC1026]|uniref:TlpA disulfide reductase family protein n=1 Tax=Spirosoma sp. KUDC1026 TaxID=2745947 RepID=UPI00159BB60B|nr:TlpA disulfide reductase family protein [Spirosoma sp. KUDC1026]QKZ11286.1 TlpA family protein disulfide reductase [Spirosoma sp. KUDC1026]
MKKLAVVLGLILLGLAFLIVKYDVKIKLGANEQKITGDNNFVDAHLNQSLPPFTLTDLNGNEISSQALTGKRVHINFWSTSCKPCLEEFSELNHLKAQAGDDVVFLAMAPDNAEKVSRTVHRRPFNYTLIPDAGQYLAQLGVTAYPKNFFVDRAGIVRRITEGSQQKLDGASLSLKADNFNVYRQILDAMK